MQMNEAKRRPALAPMWVENVPVRTTLEQFGEDCLSNPDCNGRRDNDACACRNVRLRGLSGFSRPHDLLRRYLASAEGRNAAPDSRSAAKEYTLAPSPLSKSQPTAVIRTATGLP
jgi:hypothetical protein